MKKLLFILSLSFSSVLFAQERNGITYQALIVDPSGEFLPGADNNYSPLKNTSVCLQFHIIDSTNSYEYSEQHTVTTDNFGMVNLVIGTGSAIGGVGWENVSWSASAKSLKVDVDKTGSCSSFEELSNQPLTSVPFALYSPGSDTPGPQGDPGEEGMSAYEVWLDLGNTGTEQDFIDSLKGPEGDPGDPGTDGDSAYDVWIEAGNTGTEQEFLDSLKATDGNDGDSAYDIWLSAGNTGTEQDFLDSLIGNNGDSAYDIWIEAGNTGTEQEFLDSLKGADGVNGNDNTDGLFNAIRTTETQLNLSLLDQSSSYASIIRNKNYWGTNTGYDSPFYTDASGGEVSIYDNNLEKIGQSINIDSVDFIPGFNKFDIENFSSIYGISSSGDKLALFLRTKDQKKYFAFVSLENNVWEVTNIIEWPDVTGFFKFNNDLSSFFASKYTNTEKSFFSYSFDFENDTINLVDQINLPVSNNYSFYFNDKFSKLIITGFNESPLNLQVLKVEDDFSFTFLYDFQIPHNFIPYSNDKPGIYSLSMSEDASILCTIIGVRTENYPQTVREYEAIVYSVTSQTFVKRLSSTLDSYWGGNSDNWYMSSPSMYLNENGTKVFFKDRNVGYEEGGFWNVYDITNDNFLNIGGDVVDGTMEYIQSQIIEQWRGNLIFTRNFNNTLRIQKVY